MSTLVHPPQVRELDRRDISSILSRNCVGRLAFAWGGQIDLRPIHYVYASNRLYGRTSFGEKFDSLDVEAAPRVAFEVDEIESFWRWRSVIARGDFRLLSEEGEDAEERATATELLRRIIRSTFLPGDPFPERGIVFRVLIDEVTGRAMG